VTALEHPPYSPELAAADFYLFPRLKSALKGRRFCDATDIIKNVTGELKRLVQRGFQECFQQLYSRRQKCIVVHEEYFEGNVAEMIVLLVFLRKKCDFGKILNVPRAYRTVI
jgi:hypothetical protein